MFSRVQPVYSTCRVEYSMVYPEYSKVHLEYSRCQPEYSRWYYQGVSPECIYPCQPNYYKNVSPDPKKSCGPFKPLDNQKHQKRRSLASEKNHDTIGMVAFDQNGKTAAGTTTNGMIYKIPGRVGDSPIPGKIPVELKSL